MQALVQAVARDPRLRGRSREQPSGPVLVAAHRAIAGVVAKLSRHSNTC